MYLIQFNKKIELTEFAVSNTKRYEMSNIICLYLYCEL